VAEAAAGPPQGETADGPGAAVRVIGVGNRLRGDDAVGLAVAAALRGRTDPSRIAVLEQQAEALGLLEQWEGARAVVLIDATHSGAPPGTIHRVEASHEPLPAELGGSTSTHALGLVEAIELARALGRLPARLIVLGIEGERFDAGRALTPAVSVAAAAAVEQALALALELAG
jgi:hydrogenase maturation protease